MMEFRVIPRDSRREQLFSAYRLLIAVQFKLVRDLNEIQ